MRERIAAAAARAGRDPDGVLLLAVTKTVAVERIREAVEAGVRDLGESRVQEAEAKRPELPPGIRLHMVGHVQVNKAGRAAQLFDVVHSVDSERLAHALARRRQPASAPLEVLVEVELTGLPGRAGCAPEVLPGLVTAIAAQPALRIGGLMTVAEPDPAAARRTFARLSDLRDQVTHRTGIALPQLSMGMSDDLEVAVEEGATIVRVGRAIFG